ncbi:ProQ/FINO family protein [Halomonas salinarum]|uniref:ProQ/FINO family protein n=1 Tax=Halomonas salinarum TaxID=1158993 RepID=UPI001FD76AD4|nr:ProQ/FINO family protein [Halomonas salinarum]
MNNERTATLLATLEVCANEHLDALVRARNQVVALQEQKRQLEVRNRELEQHSLELERRSHELKQQHHELALKHQALEEKCRELEEKFARAPHTADGHAHPRSQGLKALLSHRARPGNQEAPAVSLDETPVDGSLPESRHAASTSTPGGEPSGASLPEPHANETAPQASLPEGELPSPQALLNQWYRRYPDAFFKGHTRPLRVGIHEDLLSREPWPEKLVRRALACYVHLPRYLKAVRENAERVGLDGEAAGPVTEGEARYARKKLDELRAQQQNERSGAKRSAEKTADKAKEDKREPRQRHGQNSQAAGKPSTKAGRPKGAERGRAPAQDAKHDGAHDTRPTVPVTEPSEVSASDAPADRLERKLGALLAKHSPR